MRIKHLKNYCGVQGSFQAGSIADLPEPLARYLVSTNQALAIDPMPEPSAERAELEPRGETATIDSPKPRRRKKST